MIIRRLSIPRRTVLRGLGAALALPFLDAMVPALAAVTKTAVGRVKRLGFVYFPHGSLTARQGTENTWTPHGENGALELSPILQPLAPFQNGLIVPTNLGHNEAEDLNNGDHSRAGAVFLSAARAKKTEGSDVLLGTTVDQIAAGKLGQDTRLPSLELALDYDYLVGNCDGGYSCTYVNCLSWSSPTTPLPAEANPRLVFERMFGEGGTRAEVAARNRTNRSILDWVLDEIKLLQRSVGSADRVKVGEYLDTVREVERRIQLAEHQTETSVALERPVGIPENWEEHAKLMFDLQLLAFQADITRVFTFQIARELNTRSYPQVGVTEAHHALSHHQGDPKKLADLAKVNTYHVGLFAYFLSKLAATPDGDGSLLDHSILLYGSGMGDGNLHDHQNLPLVLAGGGLGSLKGGHHIKFPEATPMANLLLGLLDRIGVPMERFGDSTESIDLGTLI
jgi:hypothetical protein